MKSTLAVKHYHIIFTVPHELNQIYLWDRRLYYNILFRAASRTLHSFGYTHYGCETGAVAVLPPSVQHRNGSGFTTVMCITEAVQRTAGSTEQDVAIKPSVPQINLVELMRYRENDVVVFHRKC